MIRISSIGNRRSKQPAEALLDGIDRSLVHQQLAGVEPAVEPPEGQA